MNRILSGILLVLPMATILTAIWVFDKSSRENIVVFITGTVIFCAAMAAVFGVIILIGGT